MQWVKNKRYSHAEVSIGRYFHVFQQHGPISSSPFNINLTHAFYLMVYQLDMYFYEKFLIF